MIVKMADELRDTVRQVLLAGGADQVNADCVADHLVLANLSGVDTHGVWHVANYVADMKKGQIAATASPAIVKQTANSALVKGNWAFGHLAARTAMQTAIDKCGAGDIAVVGLVQANHIGRLGHYVEMAVAADKIALVWGGGYGRDTPRTVPFGGRQPVLDTNPVAIGVPAGDDGPMMLDFATTAMSGVKVRNARKYNQQLPPGCAVDKHGKATTDPHRFFDGGAFVPFGGHKGYALMMAAEYLGGMLGGSDDFVEADQGVPLFRHQGVTMIVFKADMFQPLDAFVRQADEMGRRVRAIAPAEGFEQVLVPGDPEVQTRATRRRQGIPLPDDVWQSVKEAGASVGVRVE